ncbi:MAG TPA: FHA domain-containing protein, partial [Terriglobia bacterium]
MPKLVLKFEAAVLKEVPIGAQPVSIGRAPDNDIQIDNLAVSSHHAKVYSEEGRLVVEDLNSLNGT